MGFLRCFSVFCDWGEFLFICGLLGFFIFGCGWFCVFFCLSFVFLVSFGFVGVLFLVFLFLFVFLFLGLGCLFLLFWCVGCFSAGVGLVLLFFGWLFYEWFFFGGGFFWGLVVCFFLCFVFSVVVWVWVV